jgi:predicted neuraminidase
MTAPRSFRSGFVFESAPFPACHAPTIAATPPGLVAAWFGGSQEGATDVGIWLARSEDGERWGEPWRFATGTDAAGRRQPCWNPVLHRHSDGTLRLFWRVGPSPRRWWSLMAVSTDDGQSWGEARPLPDGRLGPIKNKPLEQADGSLICPSSTEHLGWRCHVERLEPAAGRWSGGPTLNPPWSFLALQPALLDHGGGRLQALCRTRNAVVAECWSENGGATWTPMAATALANPNSAIDAVTLRDGRHLIVLNPVRRGRTPLVLAVSSDGRRWEPFLTLEDAPGEYSYPAVVQAPDGRVHIAYTWRRSRIRHVVVERVTG